MRRAVMLLWSAFAALALLLAALGLYGVLSYFVTQHTPGNRCPHGARRASLRCLAAGLATGTAAGRVGCRRRLAGRAGLNTAAEESGLRPRATDPLTFALVPLLLGGVALAACWIPARRATKVDPMTAPPK